MENQITEKEALDKIKEETAHITASDHLRGQEKEDMDQIVKEAIEADKNKVDKLDMEKYIQERRRHRSNEGDQQKLWVDPRFKEAGWEYRWVRGTPDRIQKFQRKDWHLVIDPELAKEKGSGDSVVSTYVGHSQNGAPRRDVLMRIRTELYNDDQKAKMEDINKVEKEIKEGNFKTEGLDNTHYIPNVVKRINKQ